MRDWGAKLAGATLRLAAVMHCVEQGGAVGHVERHALSAAVAIAKYLIPHAETVLGMMLASDDVTQDEAHYVLRWIERHRRAEFTKSEVQHHGKRRFPRADDVDPALAELKRRGYIRPKPAEASGPGRPSSPTYDVNPSVFEEGKTKKRSHNSRNSAGRPKNVNCGINESALTKPETSRRVRVTL